MNNKKVFLAHWNSRIEKQVSQAHASEKAIQTTLKCKNCRSNTLFS